MINVVANIYMCNGVFTSLATYILLRGPIPERFSSMEDSSIVHIKWDRCGVGLSLTDMNMELAKNEGRHRSQHRPRYKVRDEACAKFRTGFRLQPRDLEYKHRKLPCLVSKLAKAESSIDNMFMPHLHLRWPHHCISRLVPSTFTTSASGRDTASTRLPLHQVSITAPPAETKGAHTEHQNRISRHRTHLTSSP